MSNRQFQNFCEYQFKGNYNRCCNFPNWYQHLFSALVPTSLNNNIPRLRPNSKICSQRGETQ